MTNNTRTQQYVIPHSVGDVHITVNICSRDSSVSDFLCTATAIREGAVRRNIHPVFHWSTDSGDGHDFGALINRQLFEHDNLTDAQKMAVIRYCGNIIACCHDEDFDQPPYRLALQFVE